MSKSEQLYMRPVRCKYCDLVFDFPTMTKDPAEDGVPVRTRICGACISEMGQNEELRASRAQAEREEAEEKRRSLVQAASHSANLNNGHKSSLSSINSISQQSSPDSDTVSYPAESPEQLQSRLAVQEDSAARELYRQSNRRSPSAVHRLLN